MAKERKTCPLPVFGSEIGIGEIITSLTG